MLRKEPVLQPALHPNGLTRPSHQRIQNHHFELLVLPVRTKLLNLLLVNAANNLQQPEEHGFRVREVIGRFLERRRAHRLDVEADALAVSPVAVLFERPHLVERAPQIDGAEDLILVVFQPVLIVEMNAPELVVIEGIRHVVGRIEPREDRVALSIKTPDRLGSIVL